MPDLKSLGKAREIIYKLEKELEAEKRRAEAWRSTSEGYLHEIRLQQNLINDLRSKLKEGHDATGNQVQK